MLSIINWIIVTSTVSFGEFPRDERSLVKPINTATMRLRCNEELQATCVVPCRGQRCDVIQRSVRVQVENTGDTNYPFLHGIIATDRDNGVHATYKSFANVTKLDADTCSPRIVPLWVEYHGDLDFSFTYHGSTERS